MEGQQQLWLESESTVLVEPAAWAGGATCREPGCDAPARRKQGARYCVRHARSVDYGPVRTDNATFKVEQICICCGRSFMRWRNTPARYVCPELCADCLRDSPLNLRMLSRHRVPLDLQRKWMAQGSKLCCEMCGAKLWRRQTCIDHNHRCCPGGTSCGSCVRGVVCSSCNRAIAGVEKFAHTVGLQKVLDWIS